MTSVQSIALWNWVVTYPWIDRLCKHHSNLTCTNNSAASPCTIQLLCTASHERVLAFMRVLYPRSANLNSSIGTTIFATTTRPALQVMMTPVQFPRVASIQLNWYFYFFLAVCLWMIWLQPCQQTRPVLTSEPSKKHFNISTCPWIILNLRLSSFLLDLLLLGARTC